MVQADFDLLKLWFKQYVAGFYNVSADLRAPIIMKERHTERVCRETLRLGRESCLVEGDLLLAMTTALFHDIGRFSQWEQYGTYIDGDSEDHALLGLKVLSSHKVLEGMCPEEREVVRETIRCHNLKELPAGMAPRLLFFAQMLRDADKLDIWRLIIMQQRAQSNLLEDLAGNLPADPACSAEIVAALRQGKPPEFNLVRNRNDMILMRLGWIFDLNLVPSCRQVLERRYVEKLCSQLSTNRETEEVEQLLITHLKSRIHG